MDFFGNALLPLVVFLPLAGAVVVGLLPKEEPGQHRTVSLAVSLLTFAVSLFLLAGFEVGVAGFQEALTVDVPWIESIDVRFHMAVDGISLFLILLTTFLTPIVILSAFGSVKDRTKEFYLSLLVLETGMLGAFVAIDLILFYVFWEAMLIPMYLLIGIWGGPRRVYSALKFFLYTMVGSLLMLLAIIYLYLKHGTFDFRALLDANLTLFEQRWLFWAFVIAFIVKVPLFPVHTWLPDAHVEAPTAGSVILAGVLLKMGSYGLMRFAFPLFPEAAAVYAPVLAFLSVVGIVYGAMMAIAQTDMKKLIAYSSVSHMGFVVLGLATLTPKAGTGAVYQMLNHGISSGGLFLLVGIVYDRRHTRLLADFGGIARAMPVYASFFMLVALSSAGLPGTNGFVGEFLILLGSFQSAAGWAQWATAIGATGVILGAVYLLWMYRRVFYGPLLNTENRKLKDLDLREWLVLAPLAVLIVVMGVYPKPFLDRIAPTADAYVGRVLARAATVQPGARVAVKQAPVAAGLAEAAPEYLGPGWVPVQRDNVELRRALQAAGAWNRPGAAAQPAAPGDLPTLRPEMPRPTRPGGPRLELPPARRELLERMRRAREAAKETQP